MANLADILVTLDRESVRASNAPDMRRVMSQMASELRGASQRRAKRGEVVRYDGVGEVEIGAVSSAEVQAHVTHKIGEAISTLRSWGVEVAS